MSKKGVLKDIIVGDLVERRGFDGVGTVEWFDSNTKWVRVKWEDNNKKMMCHLFELEIYEVENE